MTKKIILSVLSASAVVLVFRFWFTGSVMYGGDFYFPPFVRAATIAVHNLFAWNVQKGMGLGGSGLSTLWIDSYTQMMPNWLLSLGIHPVLVQKLWFQAPFLLLGFGGMYALLSVLFPTIGAIALLGSVIYTVNTYILLVVAGGQVGVALSYAALPLIFFAVVKVFDEKSMQPVKRYIYVFLLALLFGYQLWVDIRIAYLTVAAVSMLVVWIRVPGSRNIFRLAGRLSLDALRFALPVGILVMLFHSFWIAPIMLTGADPVATQGTAYTSDAAVKFFSFADFSHTIGLLHANWPENIFGKTYFLQPEFLMLPLLAFASLVFLQKKDAEKRRQSRMVLFFGLLALVGVFLAKGANEPFGEAYIWLFHHVPGFVMFRDASKFYMFIALSYAVLIPFAIWRTEAWASAKIKLYPHGLFAVFFLLAWLVLVRQAVAGQIGGLLRATQIPDDYARTADFLERDGTFSRTLAVPTIHRFLYYSPTHPLMDAALLLKKPDALGVVDWLSRDGARLTLARWAVRYVVVPMDTSAELFVRDRKYDPETRTKLINMLKTIHWLRDTGCCGGVLIFAVDDAYEHFWLEDSQGNHTDTVDHQYINPTQYLVGTAAAGTIIFSESYDPAWTLTMAGQAIGSHKTRDGLNSFRVTGAGRGLVYYRGQDHVEFWKIVSLVSLSGTLILVIGLVALLSDDDR